MTYTLQFDFLTNSPLSHSQMLDLLAPMAAVMRGAAAGRYRLQITAGSGRHVEQIGFYTTEQESDDEED